MRPLITVTAVVLLHLCVIAVLVGVNGCRSTSGFEQSGDLAAYSGGARPATAVLPVPVSGRIPTPAPTKLTPVGPVGAGGKRTVVKGETLMSVAASEKVARLDLAKANNLSLNADLKAGQVLTIPSAVAPKAPVKAAPAPTKLTPVGPVGAGGKRTVVKGETLMSVAASEKVARLDLAKANNLSLNADLKAGQVLTIPSAVAPKAPVKAAPKTATKAATKSTPSAPSAPAPTFAPLKLVPLTGTKPAEVAPADKK